MVSHLRARTLAGSRGVQQQRRSDHVPPCVQRRAAGRGRRRWIALDGIFYQADVWLDGAYLGDPEGYFFSHSFDVTSLSRFGHDHVLAVEVTCSPQHGTAGRRNITGVFQTPGGIGPNRNPGGLWRPVILYETGPVHMVRLRVLCRDADTRRAHLRIATRIDSDRFTPVTMRTLVDGVQIDEQHQTIAAGQNDFEWTIDIADPRLWWPRVLGDQPLTEVAVEVVVDGEVSDRRQRRTGLRQIVWDDWVCSVNGERIFLKGANILPTSAGPANATSEMIRGDLQAAVDLGLDALRVHGHIADRALYEAADECGILLLQDFPLQWGHARSVRQQAVEQARAAVDSLGHHPSIAMWTAHDDPSATDAGVTTAGWRGWARTTAAKQLPSWNKSVLDRWVKRSFERPIPAVRSSRTRASCRTSHNSTAPTVICGSGGATGRRRISPTSPPACRGWCDSSASSGRIRPPPTQRSSMSNSPRTNGRVSTGTAFRPRPAINARSPNAAFHRRSSTVTTSGVTRCSTTRHTC
jgi:beta-mannosidase